MLKYFVKSCIDRVYHELKNKLTNCRMFPQWKKCHIKCDITDARIRSEYGCQCDQYCSQKYGLLVQFDGEWHKIKDGCIHLE